MATSSPAEERQLFLMENTNRRLDSILESQKKLKEANAAVRQDNVTTGGPSAPCVGSGFRGHLLGIY